MAYKREVPKLNEEIFLAWKILMKLHVASIGDASLDFLDNSYVDITVNALATQQLKEKKEHN